MTDEDENRRLKVRYDNGLEQIFANKYGRRIIEPTYALLSNLDFYNDIESLRSKYDFGPRIKARFGIESQGVIDDAFIDTIIAEAVHLEIGDAQPKDEAEKLQFFINAVIRFNGELQAILSKHGVSKEWLPFLKAYIARGVLLPVERIRKLVSVEVDIKTKGIRLNVSPIAQKGDVEKGIAQLLVTWEKHAIKSNKYQPSYYAERDAHIARYKTTHSHKSTAEHFNVTIESVKKIVRKQRELFEKYKGVPPSPGAR